jgi:two-component system NarL family sensor kinase
VKFLNRFKKLRSHYLRPFWLIFLFFLIITILDFSTPPDYEYAYLYVGPILLSNAYFGKNATLQATGISFVLTILDIWFPYQTIIRTSTIVSRIIAGLALTVTGFLSNRNRQYQQAILQQEAKLLAQEELSGLRENFASTLAHDLKTPLLGAIETLRFIEEGNLSPIVQKTILSTIIKSHQDSLQMVETLLNVYRNDSEGLHLDLVPVNLVEIAENAAISLMGLSISRRISISFDCDNSDFRQFVWVNGDTLQLKRVFFNLLTNAINHSPRGSKIFVIWERGTSYHTTKIIDNGAGITIQEIPHLFEKFYQGNGNRQAKGSGLGLYLSRQIIEAHNGKIWAENLEPNGAIFAFRLPSLSTQLTP